MGFANLVSSLNSHVLITQNFEKFIPKLQSFKQREETQFMNFKLSRRSKSFQKIEVGCCKNGNLIDFEERTSANEVRKEIERCYELIHRLGRGVIYIGSARPGSDHPHYMQALELSREIAYMLGSTTWTGAGPGLMDAAIRGALQAGKPVGGFKIEKEAGQWSSTGSHPYLPPDTYLTCRFFSARKHGFVDAAVRNSPSDRTAVVALPGGIGTLDEMFEILALIQLQRIGSELPVPFLLMNYDGYYTKLLDFLDECEHWGNLAKGEVESLWKVFGNNNEALAYLAEFYGLPLSNEEFDEPIINNV
ncbi:probable cytokinin riboside 5'-monophosphate phosphoribohydrolase LOGL10 isoform X1 [Beta vulgaris subsp. vulgaris]|uniref:probable cytokinin riboside 5'-monophosphate phosphoribohydrolase LOGL10 isoform X1 n=1 Tax=Beta vulgaris subsp. vulgaris TaxID=3555 RepID=UPI002036B8BD|nr:probable cytokinin riboside 5'-monophosphate phosphoribohydrolase LOGL10 isoform X1 [Beta vulgaris subsp. vulgaris]